MKTIFTRGLPGAGKSFWAKEFVTKNQSNWVLVNRDSLRHMRGTYWVPKQEELITQWERSTTLIALQNGFNVIIDATNLNPDYIKSFKQFLKENVVGEIIFETKDFTHISIDECIENDLKRPNSVGEKVIRDMYNKYLAPPKTELVQDENLPKCIIADLDGTLTDKNNRSPFDWKKVGEDTPRKNIISITQTLYQNYEIIFMSGRDECCYEETYNWLCEHFFGRSVEEIKNGEYLKLYMRPKDDMRKDVIVKKELYEKYVEGKYYVVGVLDDRNQTIDGWREIGLDALQVAPGNF